MMPVAECPNREEYRQVLSGEARDARREWLLGHVEECAACAKTVETLLETDTLLRGVNEAKPPPKGLVEGLLALKLSASTKDASAFETTTPDDAEAAPAERLAETLGPYRLRAVLGRGGMGVVYLADDPALERPIALKVMLPKLARQRTARERFLAEARAAAKIHSDHVVTIYQSGEDSGTAYMAMELLHGRSLAKRLEEGPLPMPEILRIARETALGLAAAHEQGVLHRDVKPDNIWLESPGDRVKLLDFGLARPLDRAANLTKSGGLLGTPAYMSPEQADGRPVDARSDLFSLGVVMYQMAAGRMPFAGETVLAVLSALANHTPSPLAKWNPKTPTGLDRLVSRLLAKHADARPAHAADIATELARIEKSPEVGPYWSRRNLLLLLAIPLAGLAGYFAIPRREAGPTVETPPEPVLGPYRELRLPPKASMFVGNFKPDPARPITLEAFVTVESFDYPHDNAQQVFAMTAISLFLGRRFWNVGIKMVNGSGGNESVRITSEQEATYATTHVAIVHFGPQIRLYLDGKIAGAVNVGHDWSFAPTHWFSLGSSSAPMRFREARISTIPRYQKDFQPAERHEPDANTFALYHLDETEGFVVSDSSGNGRHGTNHSGEWVATPRDRDPGKIDVQAALLWNYDDRLIVSGFSLPARGPLTLEAWIRCDDIDTGPNLIVVGQSGRIEIRIEEGVWHGYTHHGNFGGKARAEAGRWQHVAVVRTLNQRRLFVDGQPVFEGDQDPTEMFNPEPFIVGHKALRGALHGIRVTAAALYTAAFQPARHYAASAETLLFYPCDEGRGNQLNDNSPSRRHLVSDQLKWTNR